LKSLPKLEPPYCQRCGKRLTEGHYYSACAQQLANIDGIRSPFLYQGLACEAIQQFKYRRLKALAEPLGQLLANYLCSHPLPVDTLAAVPLHPKRLRERGFNQSFLLAKQVEQFTGLPIIEDSLVRLRNTSSQVKMSGEQRYANVRGAFDCKDGRFQERHVLLIDDVCTSGATLDTCASALKEAGAISVWGLTLTREE
jgi:ComF family protein